MHGDESLGSAMAVNGYEPPASTDGVDWDVVVRRYTPRVRRLVARRVADAAAVEDVVQETFIQAYKRWSTYDPTQPLAPWLATIAANLCWHRWQAAERSVESEAEGLAEVTLPDYFDAAGSDEHVASLDRRAAVHTVLRRMAPHHRRMLCRWELERRSTTALAAAEEVSLEVLRATVVRARRTFREQYLAVAGEGPFAGVFVGVAALLGRWRDRATRLAASGSWAEATGAWVAGPVAVAGMAMLTLLPVPSVDPRQAEALAEQPIAALRHVAPAAPLPESPPASVSAPARTSAPQPPAPTSTTSTTAGLPMRAAAQPTLTTNSRSPGGAIETDNPTASDVYTVFWVDIYCDSGVVMPLTCAALDATQQ